MKKRAALAIDPWLLVAVVGNGGLYFLFDYSPKLTAALFLVIFVVTGIAIVKGWKRFFGGT